VSVNEWADVDEPASGRLAEDDAGHAPRQFDHLAAFIEDWFCEIGWLDVDTSSRIWCPEWWRHAAAIVRLEAIYRSFEHLRLDPALGISTWLRDHADYHLGVLLDPNGPFKGCSIRNGHDSARDRVLPVIPAPDGLFHEDD